MSELRSRTVSAAKVPARITVLFWVIKLVTTAFGEAFGDFLALTNIALAAVVGITGFGAAMWWQLRSPRYRAWTYWTAVAMVAVFGTMAADGVHVVFGVPYEVSTVLFAVTTAAVFAIWHRTEKTLSIHSIDRPRRELFYWAAVVATFALGTAAGDFTASTLGLGYAGSVLIFAVALGLPLAGRYGLGLGPIAMFWFAYVLTRPLGASIADWLGKSTSGGLGLGDGVVAMVLAVLFAALVTVASRDGETRDTRGS